MPLVTHTPRPPVRVSGDQFSRPLSTICLETSIHLSPHQLCHATRYPKANPLRNIRSKTVARELAQVFTRTGFPRQIVSEQEVSFMSDLLQFLQCYVGVQLLNTSMYHPQTNGLVERFNGTLKRMLWRFVGENAIKVPQASTG